MIIFFKVNQAKPEIAEHFDSEFGSIRFERKRNLKTIRIRVEPFGGIRIKIPHHYPVKKALRFVDSKKPWLRLARERARSTEIKSLSFFASTPSVSTKEIRLSLISRLEALSIQHSMPFSKVSIRNQRSRWGSCSYNNSISLNQKLYFLPDHLRDYVLLHELAHTREKNHSRHFWQIMFDILGRSETLSFRNDLKNYDFLFYPPPNNPALE